MSRRCLLQILRVLSLRCGFIDISSPPAVACLRLSVSGTDFATLQVAAPCALLCNWFHAACFFPKCVGYSVAGAQVWLTVWPSRRLADAALPRWLRGTVARQPFSFCCRPTCFGGVVAFVACPLLVVTAAKLPGRLGSGEALFIALARGGQQRSPDSPARGIKGGRAPSAPRMGPWGGQSEGALSSQ